MDPMIEAGNISSSSSFFNLQRDIEERMGSYKFRLIREQAVMNPKPRDMLRFHVTVILRLWVTYYSRLRLMKAETLLETSIAISFESLFQDNDQGFLLSSLLSNPECSRYLVPESLVQMSQRIVSIVQRLSEVQNFPSDPESADLESQEFPLTLAIFADIVQYEESEDEEEDMMEDEQDIGESMQQSDTMVPAIHHLKAAFTDSSPFLQAEECNICLDKFHVEEGDEDVKLPSSSMPCGHVFHHQCISKWLKISLTCPLCRRPLPTAKD